MENERKRDLCFGVSVSFSTDLIDFHHSDRNAVASHFPLDVCSETGYPFTRVFVTGAFRGEPSLPTLYPCSDWLIYFFYFQNMRTLCILCILGLRQPCNSQTASLILQHLFLVLSIV